MRVVAFETEEWEHQACLRLRPAHDVQCTPEALSHRSAPAYAKAEIITTFVNSRLDAAVLAQFPHLKFVATRSTGYDHIDLAYCRRHGIAVSNVPDYGDATVAEHTFALLLGVARNLVEPQSARDVAISRKRGWCDARVGASSGTPTGKGPSTSSAAK